MNKPALKVTNTFVRNFYSDLSKRILVNRGGTRSGKTYAVCQMLVNWLFTGYIRKGQHVPKGVAAVVRKVGSTLKSTVMRDFEEVLRESGMYHRVKIHKTDKTYSYRGRMVEFFGIDDEHKARGHKSNILFCNEGDKLAFKKEFFQLFIRTTDLTIIDFNPANPYVWINTELEQKRAVSKKDVEVIVSTYKDNPSLPIGQVQEIEYLEEVAPDLWRVYGLGEYGEVEGLIYKKPVVTEFLPYNLDKRAFAMDFGFGSSPTTLIECGILNRLELHMDEVFYGSGMLIKDIDREMRHNDVKKTDLIIADSADPLMIAELRTYGWTIVPATKGPGTVDYGIKILQGYKWHVTKWSHNILRERMMYKWQETKEGLFLSVPIKAFDHTMDAARYYGLYMLGARAQKSGGRGRNRSRMR